MQQVYKGRLSGRARKPDNNEADSQSLQYNLFLSEARHLLSMWVFQNRLYCDCDEWAWSVFVLWLSGRARKLSFIDLLHEPAYDCTVVQRLDSWLCQASSHKLTKSHGFNPKEDPFFLTYPLRFKPPSLRALNLDLIVNFHPYPFQQKHKAFLV